MLLVHCQDPGVRPRDDLLSLKKASFPLEMLLVAFQVGRHVLLRSPVLKPASMLTWHAMAPTALVDAPPMIRTMLGSIMVGPMVVTAQVNYCC